MIGLVMLLLVLAAVLTSAYQYIATGDWRAFIVSAVFVGTWMLFRVTAPRPKDPS